MDDFENIKLPGLNKENPFRVPNHYFDDFSARIQLKIDAEKNIGLKKENRVIRFVKPILGLAASFTLIFMLVYWPVKTLKNSRLASNGNANPSLNENLLLTYVEGMDDHTFYAMLSEPSSGDDYSEDEINEFIGSNMSEYELFSQSVNK